MFDSKNEFSRIFVKACLSILDKYKCGSSKQTSENVLKEADVLTKVQCAAVCGNGFSVGPKINGRRACYCSKDAETSVSSCDAT